MSNPKLPKAWEEFIKKKFPTHSYMAVETLKHIQGKKAGARAAFEHALPLVNQINYVREMLEEMWEQGDLEDRTPINLLEKPPSFWA